MSPDLYPRFGFFAYDTLSRSLMKRLNQFHKLFICLKIHMYIFASLRLCRHTVLTLGIPLFSNIKMIASGYVNKPTDCTLFLLIVPSQREALRVYCYNSVPIGIAVSTTTLTQCPRSQCCADTMTT